MEHQIKGSWHILKEKIIEKWGKLTNDDVNMIDGKRELLIGVLQKKYDYLYEQAEGEVKKWEAQNPYLWK